MNNRNRRIVSAVITLVVFVVLFSIVSNIMPKAAARSYTEVLSYFENDEIRSHTLNFNNNLLKITFKDTTKKSIEYTVPSIDLFLRDTAEYRQKVVEHNNSVTAAADKITVIFEPVKNNWFLAFLPTILILVGFALFYYLILRQSAGAGGGGGGGRTANFGKAKYKTVSDEKRKVTFDDVAGLEEEKEEMSEIVEFLRDPGQFTALGARVPKGVLLVGSPGTGKTYLARAVAGEAGVQFFSVSGSDFVEMYVGMGASRVRDLFEQAKKNLPCIIFIDEIDAVGRRRGAGLGGGHDEREQTLNQILVEMDGFGVNEGVVIIAATNRPDVLDPALLRAGRFDRQIVINVPDIVAREAVLRVHAKKKPLAPDVNLENLAKTTVGFTPADLENILNEAALLAARRKHKAITNADIEDAKNKVIMGPEKKSRKVTEKDRRLVAYHEAGHAIVSYFLPTQDPVHEISIIPRGMAGGYTMYLPTEDKSMITKTELSEDIISLLGGRVAEALMLSDISTGASNDIQRATQIARTMVTKYGFSEKLGTICFDTGEEVFLGRDFTQSRNVSESVSAQIDAEVHRIVTEAYASAEKILSGQKAKLQEICEILLSEEKLTGESFLSIMKGEPFVPPAKPQSKEAELEAKLQAELESGTAPDPNKQDDGE